MNEFGVQVERLGGTVSFLVITAIFGSFMLLMWACMIGRSVSIYREKGSFNSTVYEGVLFNTDATRDEDDDEIDETNLALQDSDIYSHAYRMYLIGENSITFPWFITKDFPNRALPPAQKEKFLKFIKYKQALLDWSEGEKNYFLCSKIFYPPCSRGVHQRTRK